jgi:anti-anti-sigma factor
VLSGGFVVVPAGDDEVFTTWASEITEPKASVVFLCGELDASSSPSFLGDMQGAVDPRRDMVMDVHLLSYVDSTGVAAILSIDNAVRAAGRRMCLVGCHGLMSKILDNMGVRARLVCCDDMEQVAERLAASSK